MSEKWPAYGRSYSSGDESVPVVKYRGHWYSRWELEVEKDMQKSKMKKPQKRIDEFNKMIRKCVS